MDSKLENRLYRKFRFLRKKVMPSIECGDGWYPIIDEMCKQLKANDQLPNDFVITKIFDRFGDMKVHSLHGNNSTRFIMSDACEKSEEICDACGNNKDDESCIKCTPPVINYDTDDEDEQ